MREQWKDIPGFKFYQVSDLGRVRSKDRPARNRSATFLRSGRLRKQVLHSNGYLQVILQEGGAKSFSVHRLVLLAFTGPAPDGCVGCHTDGNRTNNALPNLRWATPAANQADSVLHGTKKMPPSHRGTDVRGSKLNEEKVRAIRSEPNCVGVVSRLAREYGVSAMCISSVRRGQKWRHVQ